MNHNTRAGKLIKKIRTSKNLTINEVSESTGVSVSMISLVENGKRLGSRFVLDKLLKYYEIPIEVIMFRAMNLSEMKFKKKESFRSVQKNMNQIIDEIFDIRVLDEE